MDQAHDEGWVESSAPSVQDAGRSGHLGGRLKYFVAVIRVNTLEGACVWMKGSSRYLEVEYAACAQFYL